MSTLQSPASGRLKDKEPPKEPSRLAGWPKAEEPPTIETFEHHKVAEPQPTVWTAARSGRLSDVKAFLEIDGVHVDTADSSRSSALMLATIHGHVEIVEFLLKQNASTEARDLVQWTPLMVASAKGLDKIVRLLLDRNAEPNAMDDDQWTPLMIAASQGRADVVSLLLDVSADTEATHRIGWTALMFAAQNGHVNVVRLLLGRKANIEATDGNQQTALMAASQNGRLDVTRLLLGHKANIEALDANQSTVLMLAARNGHSQVTSLLLSHWSDGVNAKDKHHMTALMLAARNGYVDVARLLLDSNASVDATDNHRWTPLMFAVQNGHLEMIKLLLDRNANTEAADETQSTALMIAAANEREDVTRLLLDRNANIEAMDSSHWTALMVASSMGQTANVTLLLDRKAGIKTMDLNGWTPLIIAAQTGHANVARLLLDRDASIVNATDRNQQTALMFAAQSGHSDVAWQLLNSHAKPDKVNTNQRTALMLAAQNGHVDVANALLNRKANIEARDLNQRTSLMLAAQNGHANVARLLLDRDAIIDAVDDRRFTALLIASESGHVQVARLLLDRNANVKVVGNGGASSLALAVESHHQDVVKLLLAKNADVNSADVNGYTPLMRSAMEDNASIVSILLASGANVHILNRENKTALDYALELHHMDIITMINRHIVNQEKQRYHSQLDQMRALCNETHVNQALCLFVHDRLHVLWGLLDSNDLVSEVSRILDAYRKFLQTLAQRDDLLDQLMSQREVLATLEQFHLEIDTTLTRLNVDKVREWNVQWQMHLSEMAGTFRSRVSTDVSLVKDAQQLEKSLGSLEDEMIRSHDQPYLSAMQFVRDAILQELNTHCAVDVFLLKVTNLSIDRPKTSVFVVDFQVGTDTARGELTMRNDTRVWDIGQGFRFSMNWNMEKELNVQLWVHNPDTYENNVSCEGKFPLVEHIGGILIPLPKLSPQASNVVVAYPFDVPRSFGYQEHQSMIHLKFCYSDELPRGPLTPIGAPPGCIVCGAPVLPGRLYCASCGHVFNQNTLTETLPIWFIPRQKIWISTVEKLTGQGFETNVLDGSLEHDSSVDVWSISTKREHERAIVIHQIDLWFMLNHPHIMRLYGACHVGKPILCVCEHAAYQTNDDYLSMNSNPKHVWRVLYEAALGLHYLHSQRVVHGDIRSENIAVGIDGKTKLCNLGYSYRRRGSSLLYSRHSSTGIRCMAPERIKGDDMMEPLFESDIYEFGMTIVKALTGSNPWGSASTNDILHSVLEKSESFAWPEGLDEAVWSLVMQMCAFDLKKRPQIATVADALKVLAFSQGRYVVPTEPNLLTIEDAFERATLSVHRHLKQHLHTEVIPDESMGQIPESSKEKNRQRVHELCSQMAEIKPMVERMLLHLDRVEQKWETMGEHQRTTVKACHTSIANDVYELIAKYGHVRTITRLLCGPRLAEACRRCHSQLHYLVNPSGGTNEWEKEWDEDNQFRQTTTKAVILQPDFLLSELQEPDAQSEALSFIFDQSADSMAKHNDIEQKLMEKALQFIKLSSSSTLKESAPAWFVSSSELKFKSNGHFATGGYGSVHYGTWNGVDVVIKTLHCQDVHSHAMFLKEAEIWFMLNHPHVLNLFCACHVGNPFFVCEYASGGTLMDYASRVQRRSQLWHRIHEAALGLQYIHSKNIVHHDIKSNNILIGADGKAKVADFGLSFFATEAVDFKASSAGTGAIHWQAPEVIGGNSCGSFASDMYSFGMCLLEIVSGNAPWGGFMDVTVRYKVLKQKALPTRPAQMTDAQWELVTQMCAWDPNERLGIDRVIELLETIVFDELDLEWTEVCRQREEKTVTKTVSIQVGSSDRVSAEWRRKLAGLSWKQLIQLQANVKETLYSEDNDQEEPALEPDLRIDV